MGDLYLPLNQESGIGLHGLVSNECSGLVSLSALLELVLNLSQSGQLFAPPCHGSQAKQTPGFLSLEEFP